MSDSPIFIDRAGRRYQAMPGRPIGRLERRIYVRVTVEEYHALKAAATHNQLTVADLVRDAVNSIATESGVRRIFPPSHC